MIDKNVIKEVLINFSIEDFNTFSNFDFKIVNQGHINDTFIVSIKNNKYVLQKINIKTFPNVEGLINNIRLVTEYINQLKNPTIIVQQLIKTKDGKYYLNHETGYYRLYDYVDGISYQKIKNSKQFYYSAVAFGNFAKELNNFDASQLVEIIHKFHDTRDRFEKFLKVLQEDKYDRAQNALAEINFILTRQVCVADIVDKLESGEIPYRVTHNDTKLNNVIFDKCTNKPKAIIDLDTIMPGSICYDFGDSIRFGCNTAAEDEENLELVNFDINLFKAYVDGYISAVYSIITEAELNNLVKGAWMMTFECGMRFLTDYLDGDNYFKVCKNQHNLFRARTQFKLVAEMEEHKNELEQIIKDVYLKYSESK